jgi:glycosyltransferase involved in cell wall biosynthesis
MESYLTAWTARYRKVNCFISPSHFLARKVLEMGLPARRMEVLPNFFRHEPSSSGDRSGILFVGRLSREKGVDTLIRAVTQVPEVHLTVIGDGPERSGLESLASSLDARVTFLGWLERNRVLDTMRRSELLCVPSVWYENCPIVVLEAMGSDLPIAVSDIGGLPELVMGGKCGSIVPPGSVDGWAAAMRRVRANPKELRERAEHAALSLLEHHSPEAFVCRLIGLYNDAALDDRKFSLGRTP